METHESFKGKKVAILGLSVEGLDSLKFFLSEKALVTCCDRRTPEELGEEYPRLKEMVTLSLGQDTYLKNLDAFDMVVRTPGMNPRLPELVALAETHVKVTSLTRLFFALCPGRIIGVTGTKGKGTTSTLISEILRTGGKRVYLGGNVGVPLLSNVRSMHASDWVVLELSSFQLEDMTQSPHIAVVLRITQDHLANYDRMATNYHKTREDYIAAKLPIVRHQRKDDIAILLKDDETSRSFASQTQGRVYYYSRSDKTASAFVSGHTVFLKAGNSVRKVCSSRDIALLGVHNLENIAGASLAAHISGIGLSSIRRAVRGFKGLEHRLEEAGSFRGVSFYNDSFSTVPETTIAALESFSEPVILIAGGSEKGSDFTNMGAVIAGRNVKAVIVIGQMTGRIVESLNQSGYRNKIITGLRSMQKIVRAAVGLAAPGDVVLLSPACASFDMFKNYKERGKQFKHEVAVLSS